MEGTPQWMVYNKKSFWNGWFGSTSVLGNLYFWTISTLANLKQVLIGYITTSGWIPVLNPINIGLWPRHWLAMEPPNLFCWLLKHLIWVFVIICFFSLEEWPKHSHDFRRIVLVKTAINWGCFSSPNLIHTKNDTHWRIQLICLVVWMFLFFHILGIIPTDSYFSEGLKPSTSYCLKKLVMGNGSKHFNPERWMLWGQTTSRFWVHWYSIWDRDTQLYLMVLIQIISIGFQ